MNVEREAIETTAAGAHNAQPMEQRLLQIVYLSTASSILTRDELLKLLEESRERNAKTGITGLLLYKDGNIMHVLEGGDTVVKALYRKIRQDPRHHGIITLIQEPIEERQFPDWSMAFHDLDSADGRDIPGYSEFLNTPLTGEEFFPDPTRCQKLLLLFKKTVR